MRDSQIINRFRTNHPKARISPRIVDGAARKQFVVSRRDARGAVQCDPCSCTIARSAIRQVARDAVVLVHSAYLMERVPDGSYVVVKYGHDGQEIVRALDAHGIAIPNTIVTLRPPSSQRRHGAQTAKQKAALARKVKQTAEHVAKRTEAIKASPSRARLTNLSGRAA